VRTDWVKEWGTLQLQWLRNLSWKRECTKKKFKGFPMFLHLKNFKTALKGDLRQWSSRHRYRRHRYGCRHRRSESVVERKAKDVKATVSHGKEEMNRMQRRGVLPFVRRHASFIFRRRRS
jgi:hypothetical protein